MHTLDISTPKGVAITLTGSENGGLIRAAVNGKPHTSMGVELGWDNQAGHHLKLAGKVRAQVREEDMPTIKAFFADQERRHKDFVANYKLTDSERSVALTKRMEDPLSDL